MLIRLIALCVFLLATEAFAQKVVVPEVVKQYLKKTGCQVVEPYVNVQSPYILVEIDNQKIPACLAIPIVFFKRWYTFVVKAPENYAISIEFPDQDKQIYRHDKEDATTYLWTSYSRRNDWIVAKIFIENQSTSAPSKQKISIGVRAVQ